jgi:hypothetical protein
LFPLEALSKAAARLDPHGPAKPTRAPARRLSASTTAALAEIRRELVEARELLEQLARPDLEP